MTKADIDALIAGIAPVIKQYVEQTVAPLRDKLEKMETKSLNYRGVWQRAETDYRRSDAVTHKGDLWVAVAEIPSGAPGEGAAWQLASKAWGSK